ncbi:MAG: ABC transporter substrate-binding protein [Beijerinckiaceae bacterium]|jgi:NitT/TauT family transport system substrate-binding protein|nr:ABC transporter substrate-binding protein [Beijerinckiaceae bacterium]
MTKRFPTRLARLVTAAGLAGLIGFGAGSSMAAEKVTMGVIGTGSAQQWALWIADAKGFFTENNVKIDIVVTPAASAVMQQVIAGALDIGTAGLTSPMRAIDQGIQVAVLGIETQAPPYSLWSKPSVAKMSDLRGKTIVVGGAKDITRTFLERMVVPAGVPKDQYDLTYAGSASARFAALSSGAVDAALLNPPFSFKAQAAGFRNLGNLTDTVQMPFTGYVVAKSWAKTHKPLLAGFMASIAKGAAWFYEDANRDEAIEILRKVSNADRADVAATYDLYRQLKVFPVKNSLADSEIGKIVGVLKDLGELDGAPDLARFIDPEIAAIVK